MKKLLFTFYLLSATALIAQPENGLLAKWTFTNGSLTDEKSSVTLSNPNTLKPGSDRFGNANSAILFNGTNDYLYTFSGIYNPARAYTISIWFKTTNPSKANGQCLFNTDAHRH